FPEWDRYERGHPRGDDYPYMLGRRGDPYNQNVLKGDYPIIGQHTFLDVSASNLTLVEPRTIPTATTPFESTARPFQEEDFGRPEPGVRLRVAARRVAAVHQRLPRLPVQRHQPGRPPLRHPAGQPRPIQPDLPAARREGHQQRSEQFPRPRPEYLHRQLLPPG